MFSKLLAGSLVALNVGQTYAAGYAWSGVNMGGFDFGCTTDVCLSPLLPWRIMLINNSGQLHTQKYRPAFDAI